LKTNSATAPVGPTGRRRDSVLVSILRVLGSSGVLSEYLSSNLRIGT